MLNLILLKYLWFRQCLRFSHVRVRHSRRFLWPGAEARRAEQVCTKYSVCMCYTPSIDFTPSQLRAQQSPPFWSRLACADCSNANFLIKCSIDCATMDDVDFWYPPDKTITIGMLCSRAWPKTIASRSIMPFALLRTELVYTLCKRTPT